MQLFNMDYKICKSLIGLNWIKNFAMSLQTLITIKVLKTRNKVIIFLHCEELFSFWNSMALLC